MNARAVDERLPLHVQGLSCRRGERLLFSNLDFTLRTGELVWLRGNNGQGKTSLLRLMAGLVEPEAGTVQWLGHLANRSAGVAALPLYVAHANALKDDLTACEALGFLVELSVHAPPAPTGLALDAALQNVGMLGVKNTLVRALSQGQRRRVALARLAMPNAPRLWLLDEPYDALDLAGTQALNRLLGEQLARGGSAVLTSHQALSADAPQARAFWLAGQPQSTAALQRDNRVV